MRFFQDLAKASVLLSLAWTTLALPLEPVDSKAIGVDSGINIPSSSDLKRRISIPTTAECRKHLHVVPGTSLFYSGIGGHDQATRIRDGRWHLRGYKVLNEMWKNPKWHLQYLSISKAATHEFWDNCSAAMAQLSLGKVYVILPPGEKSEWNHESTWGRMEWPNLNSAVDSVIRLDPSNEYAHTDIYCLNPNFSTRGGCLHDEFKRVANRALSSAFPVSLDREIAV